MKYLMLLIPLAFSACCETQYVYKTVEVKVPVKCTTPDTFCSEENSLKTSEIGEVLRCIVELRESNNVCK